MRLNVFHTFHRFTPFIRVIFCVRSFITQNRSLILSQLTQLKGSQAALCGTDDFFFLQNVAQKCGKVLAKGGAGVEICSNSYFYEPIWWKRKRKYLQKIAKKIKKKKRNKVTWRKILCVLAPCQYLIRKSDGQLINFEGHNKGHFTK